MDERIFLLQQRIALYRRYAANARSEATKLSPGEMRAEYERLAKEWEILAQELEPRSFVARRFSKA